MCSFSGRGKLVKHKSSSPPSILLLLLLTMACLHMVRMEASAPTAGASVNKNRVEPEDSFGSGGFRVLSPRSVEIKYGTLRGLLISLESNDSPNQQQPHFPASLSLSPLMLNSAAAPAASSATSSSSVQSIYSASSNPSSRSTRRRRERDDVTTNESTRTLAVPTNTRRSMSSDESEGSIEASAVTRDPILIVEGTSKVSKQKQQRQQPSAASVNSHGSEDKLNETSKRWRLSASSSEEAEAGDQSGDHKNEDNVLNDERYNNGDQVTDMNLDHVSSVFAVSSSISRSQDDDAFNGNRKDSSHVPGSKGRASYALHVNDPPHPESASLTASSSPSASPSSSSSSSQPIKGKIMGSKSSPVSGASSASSSSAAAGGQRGVRGYVEVFRGIPYATPPVSSLRFMPPVTPAYWKGTRLFTKFAAVCPQVLPVIHFDHDVYDHAAKLPIPASLISSGPSASLSSSAASASTASPRESLSSTKFPNSFRQSFASSPPPSAAATTASSGSGDDDVGTHNLIYSLTSRAAAAAGSNLNFMQRRRSITASASSPDWRSGGDQMKNSVLVSLHQNVEFSPQVEEEMGQRVHSATGGEHPAFRAKGSQSSRSTSSSGPDSLETKALNHKDHQHLQHDDDDVTNGDSMQDNESQRREMRGKESGRRRRRGTSSANIRTKTAAAAEDNDGDDEEDNDGASVENHHSSLPSADQRLKSSPEYIASILPFLQNQSEDCLYLNVYAPYPESAFRGTAEDEKMLRTRKLPVLLFIHGDNLFWGSGNYVDASLISFTTNIIVITLNYRLGVFGFLPITSDGRKRGNYGLYDVIAVLRWVHDNIQAFGGDPDRVSLAGHGIGSDFVDLLATSPLAKGLFSRSILMSGAGLDPVLLSGKQQQDNQSNSSSSSSSSALFSLAKSLKCPSSDGQQWRTGTAALSQSSSRTSSSLPAAAAVSMTPVIIDCLRNKSWEDVIKVVPRRPVTPSSTSSSSFSSTRKGQSLFPNQDHVLHSSSSSFDPSTLGLIIDGISVVAEATTNKRTSSNRSIHSDDVRSAAAGSGTKSVHSSPPYTSSHHVVPSSSGSNQSTISSTHQLRHHHQSLDNVSGSEMDVFRQISIKFHSPLRPFSSLSKQQQQQQHQLLLQSFSPAAAPTSRPDGPPFSMPSSSTRTSSHNSSLTGTIKKTATLTQAKSKTSESSSSSISLKDEGTRTTSVITDSKSSFYDSSSLLNYMILGGVSLLLINVLILLAIMMKDKRKKRRNRSADEQNCQSMSESDPTVLHLEQDSVPGDHQIRIQELEPMIMEHMSCQRDQRMTYDAGNLQTIETILLTDPFYSPSDQQIIPDHMTSSHQQLLQDQQQHSLSSYSTLNDEVTGTGTRQRQIKGIMKSKSSSGSSAAAMRATTVTSQEHEMRNGAEFTTTQQMCLTAASPNAELVNGGGTSSPFFDSSSSIGSCTLITNTSSPSYRNCCSSNPTAAAVSASGQQLYKVNGTSSLTRSQPHPPQRNTGQNHAPRQVTWHVISENCEICDQPTY